MLKKLLAAAVLLVSAALVQAEVNIPESQRVRNYPNLGVCAWCSVECLGNIHGVESLKGLAKKRYDQANEQIWIEGQVVWHPYYGSIRTTGRWVARNDNAATPLMMQQQLNELGVKYKLQHDGFLDTAILREASDYSLGCGVGLRHWPGPGDSHMVVLTHYDNEKVVFIENRGDCERYLAT